MLLHSKLHARRSCAPRSSTPSSTCPRTRGRCGRAATTTTIASRRAGAANDPAQDARRDGHADGPARHAVPLLRRRDRHARHRRPDGSRARPGRRVPRPAHGPRPRAHADARGPASPARASREPGVEPWLPYGDVAACNVADQRHDPDSMLSLTRDLIGLRDAMPELRARRVRDAARAPTTTCGRGGAASAPSSRATAPTSRSTSPTSGTGRDPHLDDPRPRRRARRRLAAPRPVGSRDRLARRLGAIPTSRSTASRPRGPVAPGAERARRRCSVGDADLDRARRRVDGVSPTISARSAVTPSASRAAREHLGVGLLACRARTTARTRRRTRSSPWRRKCVADVVVDVADDRDLHAVLVQRAHDRARRRGTGSSRRDARRAPRSRCASSSSRPAAREPREVRGAVHLERGVAPVERGRGSRAARERGVEPLAGSPRSRRRRASRPMLARRVADPRRVVLDR